MVVMFQEHRSFQEGTGTVHSSQDKTVQLTSDCKIGIFLSVQI